MSIPTFCEMRRLMAPVWQQYQEQILWAGIFGSISRNRANENSNVNVLIVLKNSKYCGLIYTPDLREKLEEACERKISLLGIWQRPNLCYVYTEALLSSRTVYGNRADVKHLRREAIIILYTGLQRLDLIDETLNNIKERVVTVQTYENFIHPTQRSVRQECIKEFRKLLNLFDIQPDFHPMRTYLGYCACERVPKLYALLEEIQRDIIGTASIQRLIWNTMQSTSRAMSDFEDGRDHGRRYIGHMLASHKLAGNFEKGLPVDTSMYSSLLW